MIPFASPSAIGSKLPLPLPRLLAGGKYSGCLYPESSSLYIWGGGLTKSDAISGVRDASFGNSHILVLMRSGNILSVGADDFRQCSGMSTHFDSLDSLKDVDGNQRGDLRERTVKVVAGVRHSAVISEQGEVTLYGEDKNHMLRVWKPQDAAVVEVRCGLRHVVALDSLGRVWSWGSNKHGSLGRCLAGESDDPGLVEGLSSDVRWVGVASGWSHCIVKGIRLDGSVVFAGWGRADMGQLPWAGDALSEAAMPVHDLLPLPHGTLIDVWAAGESSYGADELGYLWATGWNDHGMIYYDYNYS